ncbi:unnamed protein product, partial [Ectocarpus fasciculatus]
FKQVVLLCSFFIVVLQAQAQDLFFNQYLLAPLTTNPGQQGVMKDVWAGLNYRNVSIGEGEKFNTSQLSAFYPVPFGNHRFVFSGSFYTDRISESFTTNGATLGAALSLALTAKSELSFGTQASLFGTRLEENFTTDSQFING